MHQVCKADLCGLRGMYLDALDTACESFLHYARMGILRRSAGVSNAKHIFTRSIPPFRRSARLFLLS